MAQHGGETRLEADDGLSLAGDADMLGLKSAGRAAYVAMLILLRTQGKTAPRLPPWIRTSGSLEIRRHAHHPGPKAELAFFAMRHCRALP